jgi:4-amino-4-deoxy-L-arabinose transferase-like glycosyltransferase
MQSSFLLSLRPVRDERSGEQPLAVSVRWRWLLLALFLFGLLTFNLGSRGLNEPDEGRYANIALEMLEPGGSWWEPHMSDYGHYDKPPLTYWLTAASIRAFGLNETAARVTPLFGALMTLVGVGWTAWRLYGGRVAWWTVLMCGTLGQFWLLARFLTPDMLLSGWTTLAIAAWAEVRHRGGDSRWWSFSLLLWSLAWWTKATAALVPLLGLTVGLVLQRDRAGLRALRPGWLLAGILVLGAPWYLDLMRRHPELQGFFLGREVVGRIAGHPDGRRAPVYFHLLVTLAGWLPWWPVLLVAVFTKARRVGDGPLFARWRSGGVELWLVLTGLTVFSLISSKLATYTLPFAPWAALLCARGWLWLADTGRWRLGTAGRLAIAGGMAASYLIVSLLAPRWETRFGRSSALRTVADFLRQHDAARVYCDRYWPSLEFYFNEDVHYVLDRAPRQFTDDPGRCAGLGESHFLTRTNWLSNFSQHDPQGVWFLTLKDRSRSPVFAALPSNQITETNRLGDFILYHLVATPVPREIHPTAAMMLRSEPH